MNFKFKDVALAGVVMLTAASAIIAGVDNQRLSNAQHNIQMAQRDVQDTQKCAEKSISALLSALDQRTSLTSDVSKADRAQNEALANIIHLSLVKPPISHAVGRKIVTDWGKKFDRWLILQNAQTKIQETNKFPSDFGFRSCLSNVTNN